MPRFHLLLAAGRTSVAVTIAPSRRAVAIACSPACAHDEHALPAPSGGGHHHRQGAPIVGGAVDHRPIAGEIGLAGEDIHDLRARDARHQLHGEADHIGLGHRGKRRLVAVGIHDRHHERAGLVVGKLGFGRTAHLEHHVGVANSIGRRVDDRRTHRLVVGIEHAGLLAGVAFNDDVGAERLHLLHGIRGGGDARLGRVDLGGNRNLHKASTGTSSGRISGLEARSRDQTRK